MPQRNVVIVDDDQAIRDGLSALLEAHGWDVAAFGDGGAALAHLRRVPAPTVILLDLVMPRLDGALFRKRQLADPVLAHIPVVLITASAADLASMSESVGLPILGKPVDPRALLLALDRYVAR